MKKSFTVNINGSIFYIDEDAYALLQSYFEQLNIAFKGEDGKEIVNDIEGRIAELLNERKGSSGIVTIAEVNELISRVGSPEELNDSNESPQQEESQSSVPPPYQPLRREKRLFRDESNRVLGGVLSGIGEYYGWNVTLLRIIVLLLTCTTWFFPCFIAYIVAWCVIPAARTPVQRLEMSGTPVNPVTLGHEILYTKNQDSTTSQIGRLIGCGFLCILGIFCGAMFIGSFMLLLGSLAMMIGLPIRAMLPPEEPIFYISATPYLFLFVSLMGLIFFGIALWGVGIVLLKLPRIPKTFLITCVILEILFLIGALVSGVFVKDMLPTFMASSMMIR